MASAKWSELPLELLSLIASYLGLIELLRFRCVCKDWNSASATATAETESLQEPWFLVYGEKSECILVSNLCRKYRQYSLKVPELDGATCLASARGWLLMFRNGSMFFFSPFSRSKIDLPKFPHSEITDHVAAFSTDPILTDSVVAIFSRVSESEVEVNMLKHGAGVWTNHRKYARSTTGPIIGAAYIDIGIFYFFYTKNQILTFYVKEQSWKSCKIIKERSEDVPELPFILRTNQFQMTQLRLPVDVSISTCGAQLPGENADVVIFNESIEATDQKSKIHHLKGIWIQPRLHHVSPDQSWGR